MPLPLATDPRDLLLDTNNDIVIGTDLVFSYGIAAIVQSARIALQMFAGEWFADLDAGIPYWQSILGAKPVIAAAAARVAFRDELLEVAGVIDVLRIDVVFDAPTRTMSISWQALTALGETPNDLIQLEIA